MSELEMRGVESDARDSRFQFSGWIVLSVTEDRVADCRQLHTDLILQSGHQPDSDNRSPFQAMFDGIVKFRARSIRISCCGHPLKRSVLPKVMHECPFFHAKMTAHYRQIFPHRAVLDELCNQGFPIGPGFCEEQNSRGVPIDAMHDKGPLTPCFQLRRQKREGRGKIAIIFRHRQHFGRLVEDNNGIVLVEDAKLPPGLLS